MGSKTYNWLWFWVAEQKNKDILLWGGKKLLHELLLFSAGFW